jgi:predicted GH43/DUF377 family glycosyl hydrolase
MCTRESSSVGYNAQWKSLALSYFSYVLSNYDYLWCVLTLWLNHPTNFDSLITSRNFSASPRNFRDRLTPTNWSFRKPLVTTKFNFSKISIWLQSSTKKFVWKIESSFLQDRVDRWMFKKKLIVPNYVTLLETYDGFKNVYHLIWDTLYVLFLVVLSFV